jgi:thiamine transport system permease protein
VDERVRLTGTRRGAATTAAVVVGAVALFVGWPAWQVLRRGIGAGIMSEVLGEARLRRIVVQTVAQAAASTVGALAVGLVLGGVLGTWEFRGRRAVTALLAAPFALPSVVVGASFLAILPERWERGWLPIISAHIFYNVGMVARAVGDAWASCDPVLDRAAATLGASPGRVVTTVLVPQLAPLLWRLAGLIGAMSMGTYGIALMLGGPFRPTTEVEVARQAVQVFRLDRAAALAVVQFLTVGGWLWFTSRPRRSASGRRREIDRRLPADARFAWFGAPMIAMIGALIIAPLVALVGRAVRGIDGSIGFGNFRRLLEATEGSGLAGAPIDALAVSLRTGVIAAAGAVLVALATTVARDQLGPLARRGVEAITALPLAVSSVALGLGFLLGFARPPLAWRGAWWVVAVAQAVVALPFAVRVLVPASDAIDPNWRHAAATLGASPLRRWWSVDRPLLMPAAGAGAAIAGAIALGELGATSFLSRPETTTIPVAITRLSGRPGASLIGQSQALAVILGALTTGLTWISLRRSR